MGTSVEQLFNAGGVERQGAVLWGDRVQTMDPGVYVIATEPDPSATVGLADCPVSDEAVRTLLEVRPEAKLDGKPAEPESVRRRLEELWVPYEPVVYIGLAGNSLQNRINQFYRTRIGARAPHAGGWPIKMLANLSDLWIHFGRTDDPDGAEIAMVDAFVVAVDSDTRGKLADPQAPLPFANLMFPAGRRKRHGFEGVKESRSTRSGARSSPPAAVATPASAVVAPPARDDQGQPSSRLGGRRTQNITQSDIANDQIRIPRETKTILPSDAEVITVDLRGERFSSKWNPRRGPDKERSGLIRIPKADLARLVEAGGPLTIVRSGDVYEIT